MSELKAPYHGGRVSLVLMAVLVGAVAYLFYAAEAGSTFAGFTALLAIPAALGALVVHARDPTGREPLLGCLFWPTLTIVVLAALGWLLFGEGALCIAMVVPLWIAAAVGGGLINVWNARRQAKKEAQTAEFFSAAWAVLPFIFLVAESAAPPEWREETVTREVLIDADPEAVWPLLLSIPDIRPEEGRPNLSQDLLGIPRPSDAIMVRRGGMLIRKARWGRNVRFEEHIREIRAARAISWNFVFPDRSVQQHTDSHISPDGAALRIETGRYDLQHVAPGMTRLRLTTRYRMRTRLPSYLRWWGDLVLGDIQENVLSIVKDRVESFKAS